MQNYIFIPNKEVYFYLLLYFTLLFNFKLNLRMSSFPIVVIGAGTMGNGIAHVFAQNGFPTILIDSNATALEKAIATISKNLDRQIAKTSITEEDKIVILSRIHTQTTIDETISTAQLVIEAATENKEIKKSLFQQLDKVCNPSTILATNTSSISITEIASVTSRPDKVIGMHFMNPVPVMKLIEVIKGYFTSEETLQTILSISEKLQKTAVPANDYPGFVANKILMPMLNEAIITLSEGVAGVSEIDSIMKLGMGHPMGPLQLADFIGLDVCLYILNVLYDGFKNPKYAPAPLLVKMVQAGCLGIKSGRGFYDYSTKTKDLIVASNFLT